MDATDWDAKYQEAEHLHWPSTPNIFVADRLRDATPGRGLDLAAGEGRNAIWLASLGWKMTAVDFSPVAINRGIAQGSDVEFVVGDALEWEPDTAFDLILIAYLHLQSAEYEKVVHRAMEWLVPGGELFMIGHDVSNIEHVHGGPQYPEILWNVEEMIGWMEGLIIVEGQVVRR
ncbi:MAG TPA: methyltransferase domain-containing protein, partial [Acidimicrobiia bacterium]|nr:methyltransferase domain-containing protein [Acidimicrobiia bacterium]